MLVVFGMLSESKLFHIVSSTLQHYVTQLFVDFMFSQH
jgi:hypothetical protein